jgi:hypothetical protein
MASTISNGFGHKQLLIDLNNYRSVIARLIQNLPVAKINDSNLDNLRCLHPKSLGLGCFKKGHNNLSRKPDKKCIVFSPEQIILSLCRLHRGKAPGVLGDSLDIYIKTAKSLNLNSTADQERVKASASFFSRVANGEIPPKFQRLLRATYLVALEKDASDPNKLCPLGVPCAIRRITAAAILSEYSSVFAKHLLPFNYAVIRTMQLGVEKYISDRESSGKLPSRALVSLGILNMFNEISRETLCEIIATNFPSLDQS